MLYLDGSQGEGGGQIVRTALTLSAISGTPVRIERIRAGRQTAGLRPQHVAAVRAVADICAAHVEGAAVGSEAITFAPGGPVRPGRYEWAIGTAGSAVLVVQTVLLPLALAAGPSEVRVHGGTHVPYSPSGHYLRDVYVPFLLGLGAEMTLFLEAYGWMPEGGGTIVAQVSGSAQLSGVDMRQRERIERVFGTAVGCNLPSHIPQRIANRAINLLGTLEVAADVRPLRARGISTGAGLFLAVEYTNGRGGFGVLGRKGMPSEVVAEKAVTALLAFHAGNASVDEHLADQIVVPLALAGGASAFVTPEITAHLLTNIGVVRAFVDRPIAVDERSRAVVIE
ncbi:MAG: RNA 3'-terminal phosphate cyclase [Chloroflexota bacterium]